MAYSYEYPRPALTVDCVVFGIDQGDLKLLLIERDLEPFRGTWALPGGFVHVDETLEDAALRELREEAGITRVYLEQLYTFGSVERDPRERIVTVAYCALVNLADHQIRASTDARDAAWFSASEAHDLAFDHDKIVEVALERLKGKVRYQPIGFELLPEKFTLSQLKHIYDTILETELDKRNFRRKVLGTDLLVALDEVEKDVAHRAARLYRFDKEKYAELSAQGFLFEV